MNKPKLYLIPTPIAPTKFYPQQNIVIIKQLKYFIVEDISTARTFLKSINYDTPFNEVNFLILNEHNQFKTNDEILVPIQQGNSMGLLSEAGMPCIADPGHTIVKMAHQQGIEVCPLQGDSSIIIALMASGLNGQNFEFNGYLPIKENQLINKIKQIEAKAIKNNITQIFIETPYRNDRLLSYLIKTCKPDTLLCIASDLLSENEYIKTQSIKEWSKTNITLKNKPTVFILGQ